jgi:predicted nucleic acid-binding protein
MSSSPDASAARHPSDARDVLVDTPVWSLALRRKAGNLNAREDAITGALADLIRDGRAQLMGVVRQELLSGIRDEERFKKLRDYLRAFDDPRLETADYEEAAQMHNRCRSRGIAGSAIDFLICAAAHRREWHIFTRDQDFERYARVLGLRLYAIV